MIADAAGASPHHNSLRIPEKIGYGVGWVGINLFWTATSLFLFYFYTDVMGLTPAQAGLIFLIAMIWDAVTDLGMGFVLDRVNTRWGRYRPFILAGGIFFSISFAAVWYIPDGVDLFVYALIANLVLRFFWTLTYIPYTALITRLTMDTNERASISAYKLFALGIAKLLISYFTLILVEQLGKGDEARGFRDTMTLVAVMASLTFITCFFFTKERLKEKKRHPSFSFLEVASYFQKNSQFWVVVATLVVHASGFGIVLSSLVYFMKYYVIAETGTELVLSTIPLAAMLAAPIWIRVRQRTSSRTVSQIGSCLSVASLLALYAIPEPGSAITALCIFVAALGIYAFLMMFIPMTADSVDFGELRSGFRVEAISFGMLSLANKLGGAVTGWLLGFMLTHIGFVPNEAQTPETLQGMKAILTLVPAVAIVASMVLISFYKIDDRTHREIRAALKRF